MITARIFEVSIDGLVIDRVYFVGPEYDAEAVRRHLIMYDNADRRIQVRQVKQIKTGGVKP